MAVAKRYDSGTPGAGRRKQAGEPRQMLAAVESFLAGCKQPAAIDFGDQPLALLPGKHALELRGDRLMLDAWDETRSLSRRLLTIARSKPGVLDCTVQRFGGAAGVLTLLDLDRPQTTARAVKGARQSFAEQFRRMLQRQYPGWEIRSLSSALDLHRSLSAVHPRAHLVYGQRHVAALACPTPEAEAALITAAVLWHACLRTRLGPGESLSLCLFLPSQSGALTAQRLRWLTGRELRPRLFRFNEHGMAGEVDGRDLGNIDTRVTGQYRPAAPGPDFRELVTALSKLSGVGCCPELSGAVSIRFRGLEFARLEGGKLLLGIGARETVAIGEGARALDYALQLSALAPPHHAIEARSGALPAYPERWLESSVRRDIECLDADLLSEPVHGQVLTFAGGERECVDLLGVTRGGRLVVIELKAAEDLQLPVQALDYWMRVRWHNERGELDPLFPGVALGDESPKLLLVAPALAFHPANEILLRYFAPEIEVERVGVHSEWQSSLQVAFRLRGADLPISHGEQT